MKRRDFLKTAVPVSVLPVMLGGFSLTALARTPMIQALLNAASANDRVLVLVQLNGGNDGLNTVIPLDQYTNLTQFRSNIIIDQAKVLQLGANPTGLHPAMTGMKSLYDSGKLAVVQNVSYPVPNFSHFRATDIWLSGSDYNANLTTGWMGRFLDAEYPNFPTGYPTAAMPDPLAIQIGSVVSTGLQGPAVSLGMAITDPNSSYILPGGSDTPPNTPAGHELTYVRQIAQQTQLYGSSIKTAAGKAKNLSTLYPAAGQNSLADQLKIVAQLVAGGLKTKIYVTSIGGFDTHSAQAVAGATDTGTHAVLLGRVSAAITAFLDDLKLLGADNRVIGMTFSEFGRRVKSNSSNGTDHGTSAPVFVFGTNVNAGVVGSNAVIPSTVDVSYNLPMLYDFRSIYATILRDWFGASAGETKRLIQDYSLIKPLGFLPLIAPAAVLSSPEPPPLPAEAALSQNYPNPFNPSTTIRYAIPERAFVKLAVYDALGREVALLVNAEQEIGNREVVFDGSGLASGAYFARLQYGAKTIVRKMILTK